MIPDADFADFSAEALVNAIIRLTHLVANAPSDAFADRYRRQRDLAQAVLVRRCGE